MSTEGSRLVNLCPVIACPDLQKTVKFYIEKLGYDAYIDPAAPEGVDVLYEEFSAQEVKIVAKPHMTEYGSYEFVIEDLDGRQFGIGLIVDRPTFFENSDLELPGNL